MPQGGAAKTRCPWPRSLGHSVSPAAKGQSQGTAEGADRRKGLSAKKINENGEKEKGRKKKNEEEKAQNDLCTFQNLKQKSKAR